MHIKVANLLKYVRAYLFWVANINNFFTWVKWDIILVGKNNGGLGIGSLVAFNDSLLLKWHWRLVNNPNSLWVHIITLIYGCSVGFSNNSCRFQNVGLLYCIVASSLKLHAKQIIPVKKVGKDDGIFFWKNVWVGDSTL